MIQGRKGDKFQINVFDDLNDTTMLTPTSIVSAIDEDDVEYANYVQ